MGQNRPVILPFSSTSIFSAAGTLGRPGMEPHRIRLRRGPLRLEILGRSGSALRKSSAGLRIYAAGAAGR